MLASKESTSMVSKDQIRFSENRCEFLNRCGCQECLSLEAGLRNHVTYDPGPQCVLV